MKQLISRPLVMVVVLAALMAATRMHHFGTSLHLPDASLAVFVLAGFFIASPLFFGALLLEAGVLDYLAITQFGVSDYCITPAYWFLIPTYAVLWLAGRFYARIHRYSLMSAVQFGAIALVAVSAAFLISNGAFYVFSGRFPDMNLAEYANRVAQYYLPYLESALTYLVPAALMFGLFSYRQHHSAVVSD